MSNGLVANLLSHLLKNLFVLCSFKKVENLHKEEVNVVSGIFLRLGFIAGSVIFI